MDYFFSRGVGVGDEDSVQLGEKLRTTCTLFAFKAIGLLK